jgi:hypothetical protein
VSRLTEVYRYPDREGCAAELVIRWHVGDDGLKFAGVDVTDADPDVWLPQHEVPKAARALYEAAGLGVPDLPDIPDPKLVGRLAADLRDAVSAERIGAQAESYGEALAAAARELLAKGWRPS